MLELGLMAALFFILVAIIASSLLKDALKRNGGAESGMADTSLIAIGMPPISSIKAKYIIPGKALPGIERLGSLGKGYLLVARVAFIFAVLSVVVGVVAELWG